MLKRLLFIFVSINDRIIYSRIADILNEHNALLHNHSCEEHVYTMHIGKLVSRT